MTKRKRKSVSFRRWSKDVEDIYEEFHRFEKKMTSSWDHWYHVMDERMVALERRQDNLESAAGVKNTITKRRKTKASP